MGRVGPVLECDTPVTTNDVPSGKGVEWSIRRVYLIGLSIYRCSPLRMARAIICHVLFSTMYTIVRTRVNTIKLTQTYVAPKHVFFFFFCFRGLLKHDGDVVGADAVEPSSGRR